jgi:hypothetical protein
LFPLFFNTETDQVGRGGRKSRAGCRKGRFWIFLANFSFFGNNFFFEKTLAFMEIFGFFDKFLSFLEIF